MRAVSFVERLEIEIHGGLFNQAVTFGDVDNDKGNELVVGNIEGELSIFKGSKSTPWKKCLDLGMITCVGVGNLCNKGKNSLITLTAEGWCYMFIINEGAAETNSTEDADRTLQPSFTQHLPANGKTMLIADIDGDGKIELVIGYSDRVVRSFRWHAGTETGTHGKLQQVEKWQLAGQIGSMTVNLTSEGLPELMVAQPGGTFVTLLPTTEPSAREASETAGEDQVGPSLVYHPLASSRARNSSVTTEIVGCISRGTENESNRATYYALVTLDGTMMLVEDDRILWSLQVDHQLFSLAKLDVTGNGREEVVVCSWDGQTYIVNHNREVVRYQFEESVAAFDAGYYAVSDGKNVPCFVYATFNNRIYVYYNLYLPQVESTSLIEVMDKMGGTHELLAKLNINTSSTSQLRQLYHWCLYGKHKSRKT